MKREHKHTTHVQKVHADCPRWQSGTCHGGRDCTCLPPLKIPTKPHDEPEDDE